MKGRSRVAFCKLNQLVLITNEENEGNEKSWATKTYVTIWDMWRPLNVIEVTGQTKLNTHWKPVSTEQLFLLSTGLPCSSILKPIED